MSFAFITKEDSWDKEESLNIRTLLDVDLHDVSAVTYPAYLNTEIGLRSLLEHDANKKVNQIQWQLNLAKFLKLKYS